MQAYLPARLHCFSATAHTTISGLVHDESVLGKEGVTCSPAAVLSRAWRGVEAGR